MRPSADTGCQQCSSATYGGLLFRPRPRPGRLWPIQPSLPSCAIPFRSPGVRRPDVCVVATALHRHPERATQLNASSVAANQVGYEAVRMALERQASSSSLALDYMTSEGFQDGFLPASDSSDARFSRSSSLPPPSSSNLARKAAPEQDPDSATGVGQEEQRLKDSWGRNSARQLDKEPEDKELRRRWRISQANRGKKAWNSGRKHSPETIARIKTATKAAMKREDVREKLMYSHKPTSHTESSKAKIAASLEASWEHRKASQPRKPPASPPVQKEVAQKDAAPKKKRQPSEAQGRKTSGTTQARAAEKQSADLPQPPERPQAPAEVSPTVEEPKRKSAKSLREASGAEPSVEPLNVGAAAATSADAGLQFQEEEALSAAAAAKEEARSSRDASISARLHKLSTACALVAKLEAGLVALEAQEPLLEGDAAGLARLRQSMQGARELLAKAKTQIACLHDRLQPHSDAQNNGALAFEDYLESVDDEDEDEGQSLYDIDVVSAPRPTDEFILSSR